MSLRHLLIGSFLGKTAASFLSMLPLLIPMEDKALAQDEDFPKTPSALETHKKEKSSLNTEEGKAAKSGDDDVGCIVGDGCDQRKAIGLDNFERGLRF
ncbi:hypothetical protein [Sinorhizobium sp. CCBAU 05631]|uniref:hypothetical protein n=1 Tax=Sinorhizobium sp. CCBAU 05631 TaxID=794846 RepID=UPI00056BD2C3|nr:hypothetical protein [Sinorhizobium sp. CCBAU 05631]ASY58313.1 hypothetical protein SS05631_c33990 [Sinorhizobium sp. CCBAU 05631]